MFEVVKLTIDHLALLAEEPNNAHIAGWLQTGKAKSWADWDECYSGFVKGKLMICVGLTPYWNGRGHIWAIFSSNAAGNFVAVFRGMRKFLEGSKYNRVEMDVPLGSRISDLAHRRALLLGFELECPRARHYRPGGGDSALYAWVRGA